MTGPLANFLEFPRGELTKDLLAMARPGLRTKLRSTCRNAIRDGLSVVTSGIRVNRSGQYFKCSITVRPLHEPKEVAGLLLILFDERLAVHKLDNRLNVDKASISEESTPVDDSQSTQQLEDELKSMSEELHSTIEEMESSNEELKTSNERSCLSMKNYSRLTKS